MNCHKNCKIQQKEAKKRSLDKCWYLKIDYVKKLFYKTMKKTKTDSINHETKKQEFNAYIKHSAASH